MALPYLDIAKPGFSTRSKEVLRARDEGWCARTPFGLAVLRHRQAGALLRDRRLRQGSHAWPDTVGLQGSFASFWKRSVISQEGDRHRLLRAVALEALSMELVLSLAPAFSEIASALLDGLVEQDPIDVVAEFTEPFAGQAIALLIGEEPSDAAAIARDASTLGLAMGLDARRHEGRVNSAYDRLAARADAILLGCDASDDSFIARLVRAARSKELNDHQALGDLVVISIFGGVDTTRAQLAFAAALFAKYPDHWTWLRNHPDDVPQAIEEVIRARPTTTWATREALEDFTVDGVRIGRGETLHILVHATATDPATGAEWEFDVTRRRKAHFGFGGGAHHCLGQLVARTDMACALRAMLARWRRIEISGTPRYLPDSGNTSPAQLKIAPTWDRDPEREVNPASRRV
ncbi:MAG: cytochrome P450 [Pseudomonadota bacterium]